GDAALARLLRQGAVGDRRADRRFRRRGAVTFGACAARAFSQVGRGRFPRRRTMTTRREQVKRALWSLEREPMPLRDPADEAVRRSRIEGALNTRVRELVK